MDKIETQKEIDSVEYSKKQLQENLGKEYKELEVAQQIYLDKIESIKTNSFKELKKEYIVIQKKIIAVCQTTIKNLSGFDNLSNEIKAFKKLIKKIEKRIKKIEL